MDLDPALDSLSSRDLTLILSVSPPLGPGVVSSSGFGGVLAIIMLVGVLPVKPPNLRAGGAAFEVGVGCVGCTVGVEEDVGCVEGVEDVEGGEREGSGDDGVQWRADVGGDDGDDADVGGARLSYLDYRDYRD